MPWIRIPYVSIVPPVPAELFVPAIFKPVVALVPVVLVEALVKVRFSRFPVAAAATANEELAKVFALPVASSEANDVSPEERVKSPSVSTRSPDVRVNTDVPSPTEAPLIVKAPVPETVRSFLVSVTFWMTKLDPSISMSKSSSEAVVSVSLTVGAAFDNSRRTAGAVVPIPTLPPK